MSKNSMRDMMLLLRVDPMMRKAVWELRDHGLDFDKLMLMMAPNKRGRPRKTKDLVLPRKRGAPNTSPFKIRAMDELVRIYRERGFAKTDRAAIKLLVEEYVRDCHQGQMRRYLAGLPVRRGGIMALDRFVLSLQHRISRYRGVLKKDTKK